MNQGNACPEGCFIAGRDIVSECNERGKTNEGYYFLARERGANPIIHGERRRTYLAEPGPLLPEKRRLGDATRIHAAERYAGAIVIPPMQFRHRHHVAYLRVLVGLRSEERLAVGHGHGFLGAELEALEVAEVGLGVDESTACVRRGGLEKRG